MLYPYSGTDLYCPSLDLGEGSTMHLAQRSTPKSCSMHSFSVTAHLADTNARAKASQEHDGLVCFVSKMRVGHRAKYRREELCNLLLS